MQCLVTVVILFKSLLIVAATKSKPSSKPTTGAKRTKTSKRNPWESGSESDASIDDFVSNESSTGEVVPRKLEKRPARGIGLKKVPVYFPFSNAKFD